MRTLLIILLLQGFYFPVAAQNVLKSYIDSALVNNIVLQQKNISLQQASYSLRIARGMFSPTVGFQASYQTADGGRDIQLPLGDLLNGAYATLNQLTQSQSFPQLKNESINFLPQNFYDARFRTSVPVINPALHYNRKISEQQVQLSVMDLDIYKRELVKNVKTAYYGYLQALEAVAIYQSAQQLAQEGKRVNEKLLENGKGLPAYVLRANSEIEAVNAQLVAAQQEVDNARRYFNFLLNRDQSEAIDAADSLSVLDEEMGRLLQQETHTGEREELKALKEMITLQENLVKMNRSAYYPTLNGFLDLGSQAHNWKFDSQSRYYMLGLQLDIPIFSGNRNRNKIKQSELGMEDVRLSLENTTRQLELSGRVSLNALRSAYHGLMAARKQLEAAQAYQRLIDRGYKEGTNSYIETVDARNQLTQAEMAVSIHRYKVLAAAAGVERETASYTINKPQ